MSEEEIPIEVEEAEHICQCGRPAANGYESCPVCVDARMRDYHQKAVDCYINWIFGVTL